MPTNLHTFQTTDITVSIPDYSMLVPQQLNFTYHLLRAYFHAVNTPYTPMSIKLSVFRLVSPMTFSTYNRSNSLKAMVCSIYRCR